MNPHRPFGPADFKSAASADFAIRAGCHSRIVARSSIAQPTCHTERALEFHTSLQIARFRTVILSIQPLGGIVIVVQTMPGAEFEKQ